MPEPFKNIFDEVLVGRMADSFLEARPDFDRDAFFLAATCDLKSLELKQRCAQIVDTMAAFFPPEFEQSAEIMLASLGPEAEGIDGSEPADSRGIGGWSVLPMTYFVGEFGQDNFETSMSLLKEMTTRLTSEFGIRNFLLNDQTRTLGELSKWVRDPNRHVRRLVSEGTRPRLPWAARLPGLVEDPTPILPMLEALKDDPDDYVRRSVANNLNDISKDHPDLVAGIASKWLREASPEREKLVQHACRTLIKNGHKGAFKALGYSAPSVRIESFRISTPVVRLGEELAFQLSLESTSSDSQPLIIDYAIHHRKANGSSRPKVFKWKKAKLRPGTILSARRQQAFRRITTRTYYSGAHRVEILINGQSCAVATFELVT
jgi:3-methyladenine DNA glycosylase AlkC